MENKKIMAIIMSMAVLMTNFAGVSASGTSGLVKGNAPKSAAATNTADKYTKTDNYLGVKIQMKGLWKEFNKNIISGVSFGVDENSVSGLMIGFAKDEDVKQADMKKTRQEQLQILMGDSRMLFLIAQDPTGKASQTDIKNGFGAQKIEKIGKYNGSSYYLCLFPCEDSKLSTASKIKYNKLYNDINNIKKSITFFKPLKRVTTNGNKKSNLNGSKKLTFKTKDINGKQVSGDIFKKSKITMVNLWATFCHPCINELPDIQAMSEELKGKGINVIGILGDVSYDDGSNYRNNLQLAKTIIKTKKVEYTNLIVNKNLSSKLPSQAYPTTLVVDNEGNVIGDPIIGTRSKEEYKKILLKALDSVKK